MLSDFRTFLASELALLGNASHHAYSFGQANMAKRAIERLDAELGDRIAVLLEPSEIAVLIAVLEAAQGETRIDPALATVRDRLTASLAKPEA